MAKIYERGLASIVLREKIEENPTFNESMNKWNANSSVWDSYYEM